jgi:hypothetical protein
MTGVLSASVVNHKLTNSTKINQNSLAHTQTLCNNNDQTLRRTQATKRKRKGMVILLKQKEKSLL